MKNEIKNVVFNKTCHSQKSLLGIFRIPCAREVIQSKVYEEDPRQKPSGMTFNLNRGFTLIELLVVVLIIGILTAVALPQYQIAVLKSRLSSIKPILKTQIDELEIYYLEHGDYAASTTLKGSISQCRNIQNTGIRDCGNGFLIDPYNQSNKAIQVRYCPKDVNNWNNCQVNYDMIYTIYLDHSQFPNRITCRGVSTAAKKVCAREIRL